MLALTRRSALRSLAAAAGAAVLVSCGDSSTGPDNSALFKTMFVFGASLDDTGNACNLNASNCTPAPYATPRVSNGPLYVELVAAKYGATVTPSRTGGTNYSYAGARTGAIASTTQGVPNMNQQVDAYLTSSRTSGRDRALYVINAATVGNDINDALVQGATNPQAPAIIVGSAVANISSIVTRLYAAGGRHFLVLNSTDVGRTPLVRGAGATVAGAATAMSTQFNAALNTQITSARTQLPGINIYVVDLGALTAQVAANPSQFGFMNVTTACVTGTTACATPDTYFYWDSFHPTAATGRLVSARAITALGAAPTSVSY